jgi:hypothetical protein
MSRTAPLNIDTEHNFFSTKCFESVFAEKIVKNGFLLVHRI